jgi:methylated-DNA-[protein]-cysteine S-methyltransferase
MGESGHALFPTAIGVCGIAWGPNGVLAVQLPEADAPRTR